MVQAADNACYFWYVVGSLWSIDLALRLCARITSSDHYNEPQGDSSYKQTNGKYFYLRGPFIERKAAHHKEFRWT